MEQGHVAHQIKVTGQAESNCNVKIGSLYSLKAGSNVLLDNFHSIVDRMNLKCGLYATQDCR